MNKCKLLLVSGYFPYPATHGGKVDVWNRILGLHQLGFQIDLLYTDTLNITNEELSFVKKYVQNFFQAERNNKIIDLFKEKPLQVISRSSLKSIEINKKYDYLILEGDYVAEVIENNSIKYKKLIIRSQNDEAIYFRNLAKSTSNVFKKFYFNLESSKFKKFAKKNYNKADRIWFISKEEELSYGFKNSIWLPSPFSISEIKTQELTSKNVLFIGSLFMPNNIEGLNWYLNNVHTSLCKNVKDYKLIIAGSTNKTNTVALSKRLNSFTNIEFHFDILSLENLYKQASVFINPMFHGAGVKIKSINAIINGMPLVSTSIGVEGTGLINKKHFLLADIAKEFEERVTDLLYNKLDKKELVINGQSYLKENHYLKLLKEELECN
jgi:hypothetical protein